MKTTDVILIQRYKKGQKKAMVQLVKRWHKLFCNQAYRYTKDADVAKDIAQESWSVILDKIDNNFEIQHFGSWAMTIVSRKAIDWLRKQQRNQEKLKNESAIIQENFSETQDVDQKLQLMKNAIRELPTVQQEIIRLFYLEELSLHEISNILKISKGTVKSRLFYAREKLKTIVNKK